jgi:hypothetical protein
LCTEFWYKRWRRRVVQSKSIESHRSKNLFDFQSVVCGKHEHNFFSRRCICYFFPCEFFVT